MPPMNTFACFPNLPRELQQAIWSFACMGEPYGGPRIHRIAPDPVNCSRTISESARVQFSIIHQHPYPVPSLLHACRESRTAAIGVYALWPCANPDTWAKEGRSVYVNKAYDMFFFGDMACGGPHEFWFLHTIVNKSTRESKNASIRWGPFQSPSITPLEPDLLADFIQPDT